MPINFLKPLSGRNSTKGFTVVELAIVMVVAGLLLSMIGSGLISYMSIAKYKDTIRNQTIITKALELYTEQKGRLPCPAVPTRSIGSDSDYGDEVSGGCASSTCPTGLICSEDVIIGAVPIKEINLDATLSLDGWENKYTYIIEKNQTELNCTSNGQTENSIKIQDPNGNNVSPPFCHETTATSPILYGTVTPSRSKSGAPAFVLISHGEDGNGAWNRFGERADCSATGYDKENCDDDNILFDAQSSFEEASYFDDVLSWYHKPVVKNCPDAVNDCIAWLDVNDRCSIGLDSSDNVAYLQDKVARSECGEEPDNGAATALSRPAYDATKYNDMPAITFDGSEFINLANIGLASDDFELYIVARPTNDHDIDTQSDSVADGDGGQKFILTPSGSPEDDIGVSLGENGVSVYEITTNTFPTTVYEPSPVFGELPQVIRVTYEAGLAKIYMDGALVQIGEATSSAEIYLQLGKLGDSSEGFQGDFFEMIAYERVLEDYEATRIETYLKNKWRIY